MMFVLLLPEGYSLAETAPPPARAKVFASRLALYWILKGDDVGRTNVVCTLRKIQRDLTTELIVLNRLSIGNQSPSNRSIEIEDVPASAESADRVFDVFLSHNSKDKPVVRDLGKLMIKRGLCVWLDEWELVPGRPWQEALEEIIQKTKSAVVLVGADGLGPWEIPEMRGCLSEFVRRKLPVIPVLLPGAPLKPDLPLFLRQFTWVDLRDGLSDHGLDRLVWGITGVKSRPSVAIGDSIDLEENGIGGTSLIILVHGIRTRAEWQGRIRHLIEQGGETIVEPIGYGYFDVLRFLCPFWTRRSPIEVVTRKIRDALKLHRGQFDELIIVAHSFGTYIVGGILEENPDIRLDRVLLCGSVLKQTFRWDKLPNRPNAVLNEAGSRDIWPILAKSCTWGYGSTGTFGFQTPGVRDRFHNLAHSDYFKSGFAEEFWIPWILTGQVTPTQYETGQRPATPFFKNLPDLVPLKWVAVVVLAVMAWFVLSKNHGKPGRVSGYVYDEQGKALADAAVNVAGFYTNTDRFGHFDFLIPGEQLKSEFSLEIGLHDYQPWRGTAVPNANEAKIILKRSP
jgi:pimeloyl-ACP methyl ester carboxylesterase/nucleotide-binding universal stress UspA family protein